MLVRGVTSIWFVYVSLSACTPPPPVDRCPGRRDDADLLTEFSALLQTCDGRTFASREHPCSWTSAGELSRRRPRVHLGFVLQQTDEEHAALVVKLTDALRQSHSLAAHPSYDRLTVLRSGSAGSAIFDTETHTICQLDGTLNATRSSALPVSERNLLSGAFLQLTEELRNSGKEVKIAVVMARAGPDDEARFEEVFGRAEADGVAVFAVTESCFLRAAVARSANATTWAAQAEALARKTSAPIITIGGAATDELMHAVGEVRPCEPRRSHAGSGCAVMEKRLGCGCLPGYVRSATSCLDAKCKPGAVKSELGHGVCRNVSRGGGFNIRNALLVGGAVGGTVVFVLVLFVALGCRKKHSARSKSTNRREDRVPLAVLGTEQSGVILSAGRLENQPPVVMRPPEVMRPPVGQARGRNSSVIRPISQFVMNQITPRLLECGLGGWSAHLQEIVREYPAVEKLAIYTEDGEVYARVIGLKVQQSTLDKLRPLFNDRNQAFLFGVAALYEVRERTRSLLVLSGPMNKSPRRRRRMVIARALIPSMNRKMTYVIGVGTRSNQKQVETQVQYLVNYLSDDGGDGGEYLQATSDYQSDYFDYEGTYE